MTDDRDERSVITDDAAPDGQHHGRIIVGGVGEWQPVAGEAPSDFQQYARSMKAWVPVSAGKPYHFVLGLTHDDATGDVNLTPAGWAPELLGGVYTLGGRSATEGLDLNIAGNGLISAPLATDLLAGTHTEPPQDGLSYARQFDPLAVAPRQWKWVPTVTAGLQITGLIPSEVLIGPGEPDVLIHAYGSEFTPTCQLFANNGVTNTAIPGTYVSSTEMTFMATPSLEPAARMIVITVQDPAAVPPALTIGLGAEEFNYVTVAPALYRGRWQPATNVPDIGALVKEIEWMWTADVVDPLVPETAPAGMLGIGGMLINEGDHIVWDGTTFILISKAAGGLYQGLWAVATNVPDLATPANKQIGWMWIANTVDPNIPEIAPVGSGLDGLQINEGDHVVWDGTTLVLIEGNRSEPLYRGLWAVAINVPDIAALAGKQEGWMWIADTVDPNIPEIAPAALTGIAGMLINEGDHIVWDATAAAFKLIEGNRFEPLYRGRWLPATNAPDIVTMVKQDQWMWVADLVNPEAPEAPLVALPGVTDPIKEGDHIVWDATSATFLVIGNSAIYHFGRGLSFDDATRVVDLQPAGPTVDLLGGTWTPPRTELQGLLLDVSADPLMMGQLTVPLATDLLAGSIIEPPPDDKGYVRRRTVAGVSAWVPPADTPLLYQGLWQPAANLPDLAAVPNKLPGWMWIADTVDPNIPENAPPTMSAIGGLSIDEGDHIVWDGTVFQLVQGNSQGLYRGRWRPAANVPDIGALTKQAEWTWTADTADGMTPEIAPAALPGIGGLLIYEGDHVVWEATSATFLLISRPNALTVTEVIPSFAEIGSPILNARVYGSGFTATSRVLWDGAVIASTFVDSTKLSIQIDPTGETVPRFVTVTVEDGPSYGISAAGSAGFYFTDPAGYHFVIGLTHDDATDDVNLTPAADSPAGLGGIYVVERTRTAFQGLELNGDGELKAPLASDLLAGTHTEPTPDGLAYSRQWDVATSKWIWTPAQTAGLQITGLIPDKAIIGDPIVTVHAIGAEFTPTCVLMLDGTDITSVYVSPTEMTFQMNPAVPTGPITYVVTVKDTAPVAPATGVGIGAEAFEFIVSSTNVEYGTGLSLDTTLDPPLVNLQPAGRAANGIGGVWVPPRTEIQGAELYPGADPLLFGQLTVPLATPFLAGAMIEPPQDDKGYVRRTDITTGIGAWVPPADSGSNYNFVLGLVHDDVTDDVNLTPAGWSPDLLGGVYGEMRSATNGLDLSITGNGFITAPLATDALAGTIVEPTPDDKQYARVRSVAGVSSWAEVLASGCTISDTPPATPAHEDLWWESDSGDLFIYYVDPSGAPGQWVQVNGVSPPPGVYVADDPPMSPAPNALWWDSNKGTLNLWYTDPDTSQWVEIAAPQIPGVPEAPIDGVPYSRRDANWVATTSLAATPGDVKDGFQVNDHGGWIKLDGRLVNTLTSTQQAQAALLGFTTNLPNAASAVGLMNGTAMGAVAGSMTKTIAHGNLPAVNLTANNAAVLTTSGFDAPAATTSSSLGFSDMVGTGPQQGKTASGNTGNYFVKADAINTRNYAHTHTVDLPNHTHTVPAHNHVVPLGGSGTPLDVTPKSMSINKFVFLGA